MADRITEPNRRGVLEPKINLECSDGHRFFSPTPYRWRGKTCGAQLGQGRYSCTRKLRPIREKGSK